MATSTRPTANWLDRAIGFLDPTAGLRRIRARAAGDLLARQYYDAASIGRRTQGWRRGSGDANAVQGPALARVREVARDLVRNNGYAESALTTIVDHVVGWGIVAKTKPESPRVAELWEAWAGTTACDSDGQHDLSGLQKLVMRTVVESGECLVRFRIRRPEDGLPIPLQLQILEPDYLDTTKVARLANGGRIIHGVEFDAIGRRVAYWLYPEHPGATVTFGTAAASQRIPADSVLHVFRQDRPGQVRGISWFAPVLLRFKDYDDFDDATLMKQKIAACLAVVVTDADGTGAPLGTVDPQTPQVDSLEPGAIIRGIPGSVEVIQPPSVREYSDYTRTTLRAIATGLGVSYEDLTGDYTATNFSSARMSRMRHWSLVEDWRWRIVVPQFLAPVWGKAMEVAGIMGLVAAAPAAKWTAPPMPMLEPDKEGLAYQRLIRAGLMTQSEAIRERGYDPEELFEEYAADLARLDELGIVLDSDARKTTQAGNPAATAASEPTSDPTPSAPASGDDQGDGE